ncbi:MAG: ribonuclease PH [Candidatus Cloacimonetes bacterium]|nr:ribonuclease PH [Candidatus Cloacimonadota bacterium]
MRPVNITRNYLIYPEGSVLIEVGNTKVICNASVEQGVPPFLLNSNQGWITAEYSMLPRSTQQRSRREITSGKISGRTAEIQRLIGRALRTVSDLTLFPEYTVFIDCDVIQADGGTRTAAITGSCVALYDAFQWMMKKNIINKLPLKEWMAAISVGIVDNKLLADLDYQLDSNAGTDMNIVMTESGNFIEIQGTAEKEPFSSSELSELLTLAYQNIRELIDLQKKVVALL